MIIEFHTKTKHLGNIEELAFLFDAKMETSELANLPDIRFVKLTVENSKEAPRLQAKIQNYKLFKTELPNTKFKAIKARKKTNKTLADAKKTHKSKS
jgi:hypothetical protein